MALLKRYITPLIVIFSLLSLKVRAQDIPDPMVPYRLVNDFATIFSAVENERLEHKLRAYNDSTSTQIYLVTVADLGGYPASDYAFALGNRWEIGQKSRDNGALILIKPKQGYSRGAVFIATGYGVEAKINDAYAGRIIRDVMTPYFQNDDYYGGVNAAVDAMINRLSGEFETEQEEESPFPLIIIIFIIIAFVIFFSIHFGNDDGSSDGDKQHRTNLPPLFGPTGKGWFNSGEFGGGGFGGGGFSGGGGGRFGGGGAGGSW